MVWIFAIIIIVLLVFSAGFRKFAFILVAICIIGGFVFYKWYENKTEKEKQLSRSRLPASELIFDNFTLTPNYSGYELKGRVINNSAQYTLTGVNMKLTFRDCELKDQTNCIVIEEEDEYVWVDVPPKQARDFKENIYLSSDISIKGKLAWSYEIDYTEAK
jgi:hypothetical protein